MKEMFTNKGSRTTKARKEKFEKKLDSFKKFSKVD